MSITVISGPTSYQAIHPTGLGAGDVIVIGEGETRVEITEMEVHLKDVLLTYKVLGLDPEPVITRSYRADAILTLEVPA